MNYNIGDIVTYTPYGGGQRVVTIERRDENKGRPCFDGELILSDPDGFNSVWGYDSQITKVQTPCHLGRRDGYAIENGKWICRGCGRPQREHLDNDDLINLRSKGVNV